MPSYFAFYVGVVNGPFNQFVDLSWGVEETDDGMGYSQFVDRLKQLTGLPVSISEEFEREFEQRYGYPFLEPV
ncbi:MAG: hypothetical protein ACRBBW_01190 [Cellvibrionaceae bacterium]